MFRQFINYYFPEDGSDSGTTTIDDMIELMDDDTPPVTDDTETELETTSEDDLLGDTKVTKKTEEETDNKKEEEVEEDEEPEIEDLEDVNIDTISRKELLKAYPDLFKKFPGLERAYYKEQKYAELLPTVEDAKVAVEKAKHYDNFENSLLSGNLDSILGVLKNSDENAYTKIIDNYLPALNKLDEKAYYHVVSGVIKSTIHQMVQEGGRINNDNLKNAALVLNQFIYGSSDFKPHTTFSGKQPNVEVDAETQRLNSERQQFFKEKFDNALEDVGARAKNTVKSTISAHIDPKGVMTEYVKRVAVKDAVEDVEKLIVHDTKFRSALDKLWERAAANNFNRDSMETIKKAYLNKAKTLLPSVIQKHRNAALKGLGKRITETREEPQKKGPVAVGRNADASKSGNKAAVPQGMSTFDFLNSD